MLQLGMEDFEERAVVASHRGDSLRPVPMLAIYGNTLRKLKVRHKPKELGSLRTATSDRRSKSRRSFLGDDGVLLLCPAAVEFRQPFGAPFPNRFQSWPEFLA